MGSKRNFGWYLLFGYGAPLLFVIPSLLIFNDGYGNAEMCWIVAGSKASYLMVAPALVALLISFVVCGMVMHSIEAHSHHMDAKARVKALAVFGSTIGLVCGAQLFTSNNLVRLIILAHRVSRTSWHERACEPLWFLLKSTASHHVHHLLFTLTF
jgi:hypothetical protein